MGFKQKLLAPVKEQNGAIVFFISNGVYETNRGQGVIGGVARLIRPQFDPVRDQLRPSELAIYADVDEWGIVHPSPVAAHEY